MQVIRTDIPDVVIIEPKVFGDPRGFFPGGVPVGALRGGWNRNAVPAGQSLALVVRCATGPSYPKPQGAVKAGHSAARTGG